MRKLGRRRYIQLIANALVDEYGSTLKEYGTDIKMAERVFRRMKKFLYIGPNDMTTDEYKQWKFDRDPMNRDDW